MTTTVMAPIDQVLSCLKGIKSYGNGKGYVAHCPGPKHKNGDKQRSLMIWEDASDSHVGMMCFAGCTRKEIVEALHLTEQDLYIGEKRAPRPVLSFCDLMGAKLIRPDLLTSYGVQDGEATFYKDGKPYQRKGVIVPYYKQNGTPYERRRFRSSLKDKPIWEGWNERERGSAPSTIPYGLERLELARKRGYLIIVEGESDCWTLWQWRYPALGLPGAKSFACLQADYLKEIDRIYILQESDAAGQEVPKNVYQHLQAIGYKGKVYAVDLNERTGCKDPNELQQKLAREEKLSTFKMVFQESLDNARPLFTIGPAPEIFRLCDLQNEVLPPQKWVIPDILPEGCTLLAGKAKLGKSWLLLTILLAVACGGSVLGNMPVEEGEVLYISLEDNKRRLQKRANTVLSQAKASPNFYYALKWPRIGEGAIEQLEDFLLKHPRLKIIGIDTWAKIKPKPRGRSGGSQQYDEDYDSLTSVQELAGKYNIALVIVHHIRKQDSEDILDTILGSTAMQGAVDNFLILDRKRGEDTDEARLYITGRDIEEEQELLLTFNRECATWVVKGNAEDYASTPERQAILDAMKDFDRPVTMKELANQLEKNYNTMRNLVVSLRNEGKIILQNNTYTLVTPSQASQRSHPSQRSQALDMTTEEKDLTLPDYAGSDSPSHPLNTPDKPVEEGESHPLTRVTSLTTDMEKMNREIANKLYQDLLHVPAFQENTHKWSVAGSQFSPATSLSFSDYMCRVKVCIDAGGTRLDAVLPEMRQKLARRDIA